MNADHLVLEIVVYNIDWTARDYAQLYGRLRQICRRANALVKEIVDCGLKPYNDVDRRGVSYYRHHTYSMFPRMKMHGVDCLVLNSGHLVRSYSTWWFGQLLTTCSCLIRSHDTTGVMGYKTQKTSGERTLTRENLIGLRTENLMDLIFCVKIESRGR